MFFSQCFGNWNWNNFLAERGSNKSSHRLTMTLIVQQRANQVGLFFYLLNHQLAIVQSKALWEKERGQKPSGFLLPNSLFNTEFLFTSGWILYSILALVHQIIFASKNGR